MPVIAKREINRKVHEIKSPRKVKYPFLAIPRADIPKLLQCSAPEFRCYMFIAKLTIGLCDPDTNEHVKLARISISEFATYCRIGEHTAKVALRELRAIGLIACEGKERHHKQWGIVSGGVQGETTSISAKNESGQDSTPRGVKCDTRILIQKRKRAVGEIA